MLNKVISIVIRVRNAEKDLERCLRLLSQQRLPEDDRLEIIVVDNESTDNSAQVAHHYGAKVVDLPRQEFSWGRALNRGIAAASGDIVLLLSADAYPAHDQWIQEMLAPFEDSHVAAVYGRQIPRPDAPIDEIVRLKKAFPSESHLCNSDTSISSVPCSNACAAIPKKRWHSVRFDEHSGGAEESAWMRQIIESGFSVMYNHKAIVFHSHKDTIIRNACRRLELWVSACNKQGKEATLLLFTKELLAFVKRRIANLIFLKKHIKTKIFAFIYLPLELLGLIFVYGKIRNGKYQQFRSKYWS